MNQGNLRYAIGPLIAPYANLTARQLGDIFGVNRATITRWRNPKATFNQWDADRYAVKLGKHPGEIWPDWFDIDC